MSYLVRAVSYTERLTKELLFKFGNRDTELQFVPVGFDAHSVTIQLVFTNSMLIADHPVHLRPEVLDGIKDILTEMTQHSKAYWLGVVSEVGVNKWIIVYGN